MTTLHHDLSPNVDLTQRHQIGKQRWEHPEYVALKPPCNNACPAGENIQAWLALARAGRWQQAWQILVTDNPFPAIHGRVCYHPCEGSCNRGNLDSTVSIHSVERFLGDMAQREGWQVPKANPTGKRVLIVGAGPSGLAAAWHLAIRGHQVEVHDAGEQAGGMMRYGIPAYRLPRDVLDREVARVEALGVGFVFNHKVEDVLAEQQAGNFDAVYIAIGAQVGRHIDIPARDAAHVYDAVSVLSQSAHGDAPRLGKRVAVYGGGNTAVDVARSAKRLGADDAMLIYFRDPKWVEAHQSELEDAFREGVHIQWLSSIKEIDGTHIKVEKTTVDEEGNAHPTGKFETLDADSVVMALGQVTDIDFLRQVPGIEFSSSDTILIDNDMQTGHPGIFAGGDVVPTERSVTQATGLGKKAARNIDAWLAGKRWQHPASNRVIEFKELHLPLFDEAAQAHPRELPLSERLGFDEIISDISAETALHEAARCLSCGNCYECDNCYAACPEDAIQRLGRGRGYSVNLDRCTGCEACFEQCPCHAIDMVADNQPVTIGNTIQEMAK